MTADEIIDDINWLPRDEPSRVVQFAADLARRRQLPAGDLVLITRQMLETNDPAEKKRLDAELTLGFFIDECLPPSIPTGFYPSAWDRPVRG